MANNVGRIGSPIQRQMQMISQILKLLSMLGKERKLSDQELREVAKHVARDPELTEALNGDDLLADRISRRIDTDSLAKKIIRRGEMIAFLIIWGLVGAVLAWYYTKSLLNESISTITHKVDLTLTNSYNEIKSKVDAQMQLPTYSNVVVQAASTQLQPIMDSAKKDLQVDINRFQTNISAELIESLYSNMVFDRFLASDTNYVASFMATHGVTHLAVQLSSVPIRRSLQAYLEPEFQTPRRIDNLTNTYKNVMITTLGGYNLNKAMFII
jgi:hypothetical protein